MAYIGVSPSNGIRRVFTYTATANQTSFSGVGAENITLSYKDANYVDVYQNGVKLASGDYTATSGTAIVLGTGATVNDMVVIVVFDVFSAADTVSKADGGQFDGNVTMAGTLGVTGVLTGTSLDISGDIDVDGTTNLDNTDIDGTLNVQGETTLQTHLNLGDNDIIKLGASADLTIYHDGSNSYIDDSGTGKLFARSSQFQVQKYTGENMIVAVADGRVDLYYDNAKKLETTSGGIDVTGTVSADNQIFIEGATNDTARVNFGDSDDVDIGFISYNNADNHMQFATNTAERMRILSDGNVGIGTASPSVPSGTALEIYGSSASRLKLSNSTTGTGATDGFQIYTTGSTAIIEQKENAEMRFYTNASERMRIDSSGNVIIGETSQINGGNLNLATSASDAVLSFLCRSTTDSHQPEIIMQKSSAASGNFAATADGEALGSIAFRGVDTQPVSQIAGAIDIVQVGTASGSVPASMRFSTGGSERMRIDSSGNVGIGTNSPSSFGVNTDNLVIGTTSGENGMTIVSGTANSGRIQFADNTSSPFRGAIEYAHGSSDALHFYTAGSQRMSIQSNGRVNIGVGNSTDTGFRFFAPSGQSSKVAEFAKSDGTGCHLPVGSTAFTASSDETLKENITEFDKQTSYDNIKNMRAVNFNYKDWTRDGINYQDNKKRIGFIAQEWETNYPEIIDKDENDKLCMKYTETIPVLLSALQKAQEKIEAMEARIIALESA